MVRADDLGYSEGINYGIFKSVKDGVIRNIGFMVNMPASQHGYDLVKDYDICLGQHTNICVGRPLTDPKLIPSLVQENGEFRSSKEYRASFAKGEDFVVLDEVIMEIEAQYERFVEITGQQPRYFEGHAVESANFFKGLETVAERHGLKYIGVSFEDDSFTVNGQEMHMWMDSMGPDYDPEKSFHRMFENSHDGGYDMLVFHPGYLE